MSGFTLGAHRIGEGRCFVIAEAGVNHNGDATQAHRLVDAAADVGADAVKFQVFDPARLVSRTAPTAGYQARQTGSDTQWEMLQQLTLPSDAFAGLQRHATERGRVFLATPFDEASADLLSSLGVPAFKTGSGELTNHRLIAHVARLGRPVLMSTGMSTLDEVDRAVAVARGASPVPLALFHCVSNYPAAVGDCNLRAMDTLRDAFRIPVGWSDHTAGIRISVAAAAMGADLLEKHLTLDRTQAGPDHEASIEPNEFADLVAGVRDIEAARGGGIKQPVAAELATRAVVRRSLHARVALPAGRVLSASDLVALRPEGGVPAADLERVVGRRLRGPVEAGRMLLADDFE